MAELEEDWQREAAVRSWPARLRPEDDAFGGVDGIINGKFGFSTAMEQNPWWQVDLGETVALDRLLVFNDCEIPQRAGRIVILVSIDGRSFAEVYRHNGTVFHGFSDGKPLAVPLAGKAGRFVRITTPACMSLQLDEVQVFTTNHNRNVALGKLATQSSVSTKSVRSPKLMQLALSNQPVQEVVARGLKLAERLEAMGVDTRKEDEHLRQIQADLPSVAGEVRRNAHLQARATVRSLALKNPLLNFERILFVKRAPSMFLHMADQYFGWWSQPGGGIYILEGWKTNASRVRCLTAALPPGSFEGPDISHDGTKVVFAYCRFNRRVAGKEKVNKDSIPESSFYHLYEMNLDGSGLRQITHGRYDDFDPRYLPAGDIAFLSTRHGTALQTTKAFAVSTLNTTHPNGYSRCGGNEMRPSAIFTLHAVRPDGLEIRPLSAFESCEWTPSVAQDGRILYSRWDYVDRWNNNFISLWSANQDGTNPQLLYGNYTPSPQAVMEPRSVPGSSKIVFTASAHHCINGGSLCLFDRDKGTEFESPLTRLTPDVCFPEAEGWPEHYFANPWPLSEEFFLTAWSPKRLPPMGGYEPVRDERNPSNALGIYLYDVFGNLELLYRDPEISSLYPIPVAPRPKPQSQTSLAKWDGKQEGAFLIQDVYRGLGEIPRGMIKRLRVIAVPPKVQPHMNQPVLGVSAEDPGKYVLGTVPVEADGSAHLRVPSGLPVFFQALDDTGVAIQTMRTLTYAMPGQTLACIGCHEHRDEAPAVAAPVLAALRAPSKLAPGPSGSWPLRFDQLVQPVLDRQCISCHNPHGENARAASLNLTGTNAWPALISFAGGDLKKQVFERDRSLAGQNATRNSRLWQVLTQPGGHQQVKLDPEALDRFATWMDTYAHRQGHYSEAQEKDIARLRTAFADLLEDAPKRR